MTTSHFHAFAVEPFPTIRPGDSLPGAIIEALRTNEQQLADGDVVVVASKVVSISENRHIDLAAVPASQQALDLSEQTGKPPGIVQLILDESTEYFLATPTGPIIARHKLGYQLTSAGIDRDGDTGAWLLPGDPDTSARALRDTLADAADARVAVVIADSDGRADRRGATIISIGAAGIPPLRVTTHTELNHRVKQQEETLTDLVAAAAGLILGQRGRGAPVVVLRGLTYQPSDEGVQAMLHRP